MGDTQMQCKKSSDFNLLQLSGPDQTQKSQRIHVDEQVKAVNSSGALVTNNVTLLKTHVHQATRHFKQVQSLVTVSVTKATSDCSMLTF